VQECIKNNGNATIDQYPIMALPFSLTKGENPVFSYAETPYRTTWEIILPLYGKAAAGGFFTYF